MSPFMRTALIGLFLLGACTTVPRDGHLVATLPKGVNEWWVDITRDGTIASYADCQGREVLLVVGDRTYGPYT